MRTEIDRTWSDGSLVKDSLEEEDLLEEWCPLPGKTHLFEYLPLFIG